LCRQRRCARESRLTRQAQRLRPRVARASRWSSPRFARIVFANRENTARQSGRLGTYIPGGPKPPFTPGYELVAAAIEPGSTAGVLVWENLWAAPFASAVRHSGGQLVASGRIPIQALVPALEADDVEENEGG
jgi:hypothetical protein